MFGPRAGSRLTRPSPRSERDALISGDGQFRRGDALVSRQPAIEEAVDPAVDWRVVEGVHAEMHAALLDAGLLQALRIERPDLLHLQRHLGVELEAEGVGSAAEA